MVPNPMAAPAGPTERPPSLRTWDSAVGRAELHRRYDPILALFGFSQAQTDRFVQLKIHILDAYIDVNAATDEAGARGGTIGIEMLRDDVTKPMWDEIRQLFGDDDSFAVFREYEHMTGFRSLVAGLFATARISASDQQIEEIARIAMQRAVTGLENPTNFYAWQQVEWSAAVRDAENSLTPAQLGVIHKYAARVAERKARNEMPNKAPEPTR